MLRSGVSVEDIERLEDSEHDARILPALMNEALKQEAIDYELNKLAMAEAFQHAYIGSKPDKSRSNFRAYSRWIRRTKTRIYKLQGKKTATVWDRLPRKSRLL